MRSTILILSFVVISHSLYGQIEITDLTFIDAPVETDCSTTELQVSFTLTLGPSNEPENSFSIDWLGLCEGEITDCSVFLSDGDSDILENFSCEYDRNETLLRYSRLSAIEGSATIIFSFTPEFEPENATTTHAVLPAVQPGATIDPILIQGSCDGPLAMCMRIAPMPVELVEFEATRKQGKTHINWTTSSEMDTEKFIVERSSGGLHWENAGSLPPSNLGQGITSRYELVMEDLSPFRQHYLRLRIIDFDGSEAFSPIRILDKKTSVRVRPNPVSTYLTVDLDEHVIRQLRIYDLQGRLQKSIENPRTEISVSDLASGTYVLFFQTNTFSDSLRFEVAH